MSTQDIIICVAVAIVSVAIGLFFGFVPMKTDKTTESQNKYSQALGIVAVTDGVAPGVVQHIPQAVCGLAAQNNILTVESAFHFHLLYLPSVNTVFARYFL